MEEKQNLREKAEIEFLKKSLPIIETSSPEMETLIHELRVHQIQLEMQNDQLREIQLELQEAHDKFQNLYNFSPVGYVSINAEGIIVETNLFMATMFGINRRDLIGKKFNWFIDRSSQDTFYLNQSAIMESPNDLRHCELNLRKMNKLGVTISTFSVQISCILLKFNGSYQIKMAIADISELKKLQKEKIETQRILEEQKHHIEIGRIAGKIAHDFNNMLAIIMGNAEIGALDCEDGNLIKHFEIIKEQAIRGKTLTKELVVFSKDPLIATDKCEPTDYQKLYSNKNILIVEDESDISNLQQMVLTNKPFNHKVDIAIDGHIALKLLNKKKYDFITLDYILPGRFNGMHIYDHIRQKDLDVPVLFISGNIEFLESISALKRNDKNIEHLSKPHSMKEYTNCINQLMIKSERC